jgi:hypothetical protein
MIPKEELAAIKVRAEKATPGPWYYDSYTTVFSGCGDSSEEVVRSRQKRERDENCEFIARAREDIPRLGAEVERLTDLLGHTITKGYPHDTAKCGICSVIVGLLVDEVTD